MEWIQFGIKDIIDIILFSVFIYYFYELFRSSGNKSLFAGIITFVIIWYFVSRVFAMKMTGMIFNKILSVGLIVLAIIFQDEIRKFLSTLGSAKELKFLKRAFKGKEVINESDKWIAPIVLASMNMAKKKLGALIAIQGNIDLSVYEYTGERFISDINARLIENIFFKNSPLHDGAMIIEGNKIKAAGCILPVAANLDLNKDLGLRHRSALGLSQKTDAIVIIVSEERGTISVAYHGEIELDIEPDRLETILRK